MEKLLNLMANKTISLGGINFNGFSSSNNWIGYFEAKNISDETMILKANELIKKFFGEDLSGFFLLSSLTFDDGRGIDDYSNEFINKLEKLYKEAKRDGFLIPYNGLMEEYYEADNFDEILYPANLLNFTFDKDKFLSYCELVMGYNKVFGEICFLINPNLSLLLYPHSEKGYGCISLSDDCNNAIEFLNFCSKDDKFEVVFSENINQLAASKTMLKEC
ncbi:hypothetical protein [Haemophilus haemolyticus]|uniref:hypothetical protein n=1 Tax=Haemophilus haemolyticus TaxID=726 RepID=UPI000E5940AF|nr:hypothetical protein [Haemophilus haemolyticus]